MRERPLRFRSLSDVLSERSQDDAGPIVARDARPSAAGR
jgi:hypothetical protein